MNRHRAGRTKADERLRGQFLFMHYDKERMTTAPEHMHRVELMMPMMAGDVLATALRRVYPEMKVLYITGFGGELFKEMRLLWASEAYLDKPVTMKGLLEAVSLLLYGHTQGPEPRPRLPSH